jgi:hypothetical protein
VVGGWGLLSCRSSLLSHPPPRPPIPNPSISPPPGGSPKAIESDLAELIANGMVPARIDGEHGVVVSYRADAREASIARVVEAGKRFDLEARSLLLRISMERQQLAVKGSDNVLGGALRAGDGLGIDPTLIMGASGMT